jgi:hypothetical protein
MTKTEEVKIDKINKGINNKGINKEANQEIIDNKMHP